MAGGRRGRRRTNSNDSNTVTARATRRRSSSKPFSRSTLFVEGGILSDWSPQTAPRGKNSPSLDNNRKSGSKSGAKSASASASDSKSGCRKANVVAFGYQYPPVKLQEGLYSGFHVKGDAEDENMEESSPVVLVDVNATQISGHADETPASETPEVKFTYHYGSSFVLGESSHRGLGFSEELEGTPTDVEASSKQMENSDALCFGSLSSEKDGNGETDYEVGDEMAEDLPKQAKSDRNSGFLSFGGMRLYTEDISEDESEERGDGVSLYEGNSVSSEPGRLLGSSESGDSEDMSDSDSDMDDEVAEDYLEGIGGSDNILSSKWLVGQDLDASDMEGSSGSDFDETVEKLGGIALQDASKQYGKKNVRSLKKHNVTGSYAQPLDIDDLMLVKDPRAGSKKKKPVTKFPQSWPSEAQSSKYSRNFPGTKKKHRKEMIAVKRRDRMLRRGVDLEQINLKLEQIVLDGGVDMYSFPPMHSRDCSQVQRLAAIYQLRGSSQGSGKKRFVTLMRTKDTRMPSAIDKIRIEKLIGAGMEEDADFSVVEPAGDRNRSMRIRKGIDSNPPKSKQSSKRKMIKFSARNGKAYEQKSSGKGESFSNKPVSFVSSGAMQSEAEIATVDSLAIQYEVTAGDSTTDTSCKNKSATGSADFRTFELHTKGFGSKMLAKMGFIEGGGLGKDGQGMADPIEAIQRPKSLGLGVEFSNTNSVPDTYTPVKNTPVRHTPAKNTTARNNPARNSSSRNKPAKNNQAKNKPQTQEMGSFERHTKGFGSKMMSRMGFVEGMGLGRDSQGIVNPLSAVRLPRSRGIGA